MNIAKHLNGSNLPPLPKKRFRFWIKEYLPAMVFASLIGTMLDLYFVGSHVYQFPVRPLSEIYQINIGFTLVILPIFVLGFLSIMTKVNTKGKVGIILFISLLMPILERLAEVFGLFIHSDAWKHIYTFFGYLLFLTVIYLFHFWTKSEKE